MRVHAIAGLGFSLCVLASPTLAAPGDYDASFGSNGIVGDPHSASDSVAVAVQTDGKLITVQPAFTVRRFLADGRVDEGFGGGGYAGGLALAHQFDSVRDLSLESDGDILLAGQTGDGTPDDLTFSVIRMTANGTRDAGFGADGLVKTRFSDTGYSGAHAVRALADGRVVAGGFSDLDDGSRQFVLVRYLPNGALDAGFGSGGRVITALGSDFSALRDLAILGNGRIVAAGERYNPLTGDTELALLRYQANGALDTGFGNEGVVLTAVVPGRALLGGLAVQSDGKVVLAAMAERRDDHRYQFVVARYLPNGALDPTFGNGGLVLETVGTHDSADSLFAKGAHAVAIQGNGKLVVVGDAERSSTGSSSQSLVLRLLANGARDLEFGVGGQLTSVFGADDYGASDVLLQPDGKIVVAGDALVRLQGDEPGADGSDGGSGGRSIGSSAGGGSLDGWLLGLLGVFGWMRQRAQRRSGGRPKRHAA